MSSTSLYKMPAEWAPHQATWLAWPHNAESWPGKLALIPPIWAEMVYHLTQGEQVHININHSSMEREAIEHLKKRGVDLGKVIFHSFPTDDAWARDHGPIFVFKETAEGKQWVVSDWEFNKWGGKYPPWDQDNAIPEKVARYLDLPHLKTNMVLEGGSIDINGEGTLITTKSCLLNPNRNPHLSQKEIETMLHRYLGCSHILWLGDGIAGDDTDGHVDDITRFVNPTTVVTVVEEDPADENYKPLQENLKLLKGCVDQNSRPLNVVPLPMPKPLYCEGQRLPASYANFYIANACVLVPVFNDPHDEVALETLRKFFPQRKVVGIDATHLVWGLGAFHCITQQQPVFS